MELNAKSNQKSDGRMDGQPQDKRLMLPHHFRGGDIKIIYHVVVKF